MEDQIAIEDLLFLALAKERKGWWILNGEASILVGFDWTHFKVSRVLPIAAWKYRHGLKEVAVAPGAYDEHPVLERKLIKMFSDNEAYEAVKHDMD